MKDFSDEIMRELCKIFLLAWINKGRAHGEIPEGIMYFYPGNDYLERVFKSLGWDRNCRIEIEVRLVPEEHHSREASCG